MTASLEGAHQASEPRPPRPPVRVLLIADSPTVADELVGVLEAGRDIVVAGRRADARQAVVQIGRLHPEVVILDLTEEDCHRTVAQIMGQTPLPILVLAPPAAAEEPEPFRSVKAAGAVEVFTKPLAWDEARAGELRRCVRLVRGVQVVRRHPGRLDLAPPLPPGAPRSLDDGGATRLVAIAASTGGPAALATVLAGLAGVEAPILVIQHIHGDFVIGLVAWMNRVAAVPVRLAVADERLQPATVYIGPSGVHLKVGPTFRIVLDPRPESTHRPSADQLFFSVAEQAGADAVGVVLTGMGDDGTAGLLAIRRRGGLTIVQDEATSAVFGMPQAALLAGAASRVLPVGEIAAAVVAGSQRHRP